MGEAAILFVDGVDGEVDMTAAFDGGYDESIESHRQCMSILQAIKTYTSRKEAKGEQG